MIHCGPALFREVLTAHASWLLTGLLTVLAVPALSRAAGPETRDYRVLVDGKPAGAAHMTFHQKDDGSTTVNCETDVKVKFLVFSYKYTYRGREVWKGGRLQSFTSSCTDDGKDFRVSATAEDDKVRLRINAAGQPEERVVAGDVWLSSYWRQPDAKVVDKTIPIVDADNGRDLSSKVVNVGMEQLTVAGQEQQVHHYRLEGKTSADLWYDSANRLVKQDWVEQKHRTVVELVGIRH